MTLVKYVKSKKVLSMIIGIVISLCMVFHDSVGKVYADSTTNRSIIMQQLTEERNEDIIDIHDHNCRYSSQIPKINGTRIRVGATAYCEDTITFTDTIPVEGITIAVDPTVIPYGSKVYIPKLNRTFIAEDCGSAIKGNRIDIYMNDYDKCMEWGFQDIDVYVLD